MTMANGETASVQGYHTTLLTTDLPSILYIPSIHLIYYQSTKSLNTRIVVSPFLTIVVFMILQHQGELLRALHQTLLLILEFFSFSLDIHNHLSHPS